jgi:succinate dehydrogenase / fumarate reductase iron-sulfur subunit
MAKSESPKAAETEGAAESSSPSEQEFTLLVQRQDAIERPETRRIQEITLHAAGETSVLAALAMAREVEGGISEQPGGSVAFEGDCFDGACGACAMLVGGKVALACSVRLSEAADKQGRVRLAPMKSFSLVRDLVVDRSRISRNLASVPIAGPLSAGSELRYAEQSTTKAARQADLDQCHQCGACLEACPAYGVHSEFVGAVTLHDVQLHSGAPAGEHTQQQRVEAMMAPGGVQDCGNAQNCVEVCPVRLPLVDSIQGVARQTSRQLLLGWLLG